MNNRAILNFPSLDLRYKVFLNPEAAVPVGTFIIQSYAEEFAAKFNMVDLWVVRDFRKGGEVVARNSSSIRPKGTGPSRPGVEPPPTPKRRSTD